jgi:valyl-tRNA synthetase
MPFVTEELWAALPHRATDPELLIVARWPGVGERDLAVEAEVDAFVELIRGIRNARAEAHIEPARQLSVGIALPVALGAAFEALRPAIERLARARPLERYLTREALHGTMPEGGLAVIAGEIEALVATGGEAGDASASAEADRARLEKELAEAEGYLEAARARLANESFTAKAPPAVVEGARSREAELADQVDRLRARLAR